MKADDRAPKMSFGRGRFFGKGRNMKKRIALLLIAAVAVFAGADCQGIAPAALPLTTNVARSIQAGDWWLYRVRSQVQPVSSDQVYLWEGTNRVVISSINDSVYGSILAEDESFNLVQISGPNPGESDIRSFHRRLRRTQDGTIYLVGVRTSNDMTYVTSPPGGIPSPFGGVYMVGKSHSIEAEWDDGSFTNQHGVIVAIETVSVPAGTFDAYRVEFAFADTLEGETSNSSVTRWFVPSLGSHVKQILDARGRNPSGFVVSQTITHELESTSVPF